MEDIRLTRLPAQPCFDLEEFMNFSRETRLESATLEKMASIWEEWLPLANLCQIENGKNSWLAIWLPEEVESVVDIAWREEPARGYLLNCMAQYLCMSAIQELLPQVADGGCAPSPQITPELRQGLDMAGLPFRDETMMPARRYAVLTHYPFRGGCEICNLRENCPKGNGGGDFASVVLPGHERGRDD